MRRVTVTHKRVMEIRVSHQDHYDDYDNTGPGYYAWVGPPNDQSDFVLGPYSTEVKAYEAAEKRLKLGGV